MDATLRKESDPLVLPLATVLLRTLQWPWYCSPAEEHFQLWLATQSVAASCVRELHVVLSLPQRLHGDRHTDPRPAFSQMVNVSRLSLFLVGLGSPAHLSRTQGSWSGIDPLMPEVASCVQALGFLAEPRLERLSLVDLAATPKAIEDLLQQVSSSPPLTAPPMLSLNYCNMLPSTEVAETPILDSITCLHFGHDDHNLGGLYSFSTLPSLRSLFFAGHYWDGIEAFHSLNELYVKYMEGGELVVAHSACLWEIGALPNLRHLTVLQATFEDHLTLASTIEHLPPTIETVNVCACRPTRRMSSSDVEIIGATKRVRSTETLSPAPRKRVKGEPAVAQGSDDDFFVRNKTFTFKSKALNKGKGQSQVTRATRTATPDAAPKVIDLDDTSSDMSSIDDDDVGSDPLQDSPKTKRERARAAVRRKQRKEKERLLAASAPKLPEAKLLKPTVLLSSDSDDLSEQPQPVRAKKKRNTRPKAMTPPEQIEEALVHAEQERLRAAMQAVPKLLLSDHEEGPATRSKRPATRSGQRAAELSSEDELPSEDELDPALVAALARRRVPTEPITTQGPGRDKAVDKGSLISLTIRMVGIASRSEYDKLDPAQKAAMDEWETPFQVEIRTKETFQHVFQTISTAKRIPMSGLTLEHEQSKIFPSSTPQMLRIFFATELVGYDEEVYQQILAQRQKRLRSPSLASPKLPQDADEPRDLAEQHVVDAPADDEVPPDHIALKLRSKDYPAIEVSVRKSMSGRAVLKYYLRQAGAIDRLAKARLLFDGDDVDLKMPVEESGAEMDDILEIEFSA